MIQRTRSTGREWAWAWAWARTSARTRNLHDLSRTRLSSRSSTRAARNPPPVYLPPFVPDPPPSIKRKVLQTFVLIMATMYAGIGSAAFSPASSAVQETYNVGEVVGELANSMWVSERGAGCTRHADLLCEDTAALVRYSAPYIQCRCSHSTLTLTSRFGLASLTLLLSHRSSASPSVPRSSVPYQSYTAASSRSYSASSSPRYSTSLQPLLRTSRQS
jgi:hypothetical protein